ncbi:MAG TPA: protein translocase subunit SecF [Gemmatimonadaceae bacterium]
MFRILHDTRFDFIKWWRQAAILTIAFITLGLGSLALTGGLNLSIEFTGGTLVQVRFAQPPDAAELRATVGNAEITQFGDPTEYTLRIQGAEAIAEQASAAEGVAKQVEAALRAKYGDRFTIVRTEAVGPKVGAELARGAIIAMFLASLITLAYLAFRFEWRFGLAAVLSTAHDVLVTMAFIKLMDIEVSLTVVAAILTLLGYSGNDTIIIFDRVRENLKKSRKEPLYDTLNRSINETLPRSVLTHATTLAATLALLVFAGEVLRPFAWVMTFGIFVATFSSIYVASPILLYIERKFPRKDAAGRGPHVSASSARAESQVDDAPSRPPRSKTTAGR